MGLIIQNRLKTCSCQKLSRAKMILLNDFLDFYKDSDNFLTSQSIEKIQQSLLSGFIFGQKSIKCPWKFDNPNWYSEGDV